MDTMMIVMLICCYPVLWVMVAVFASSAKGKKEQSFGLWIPEDEQGNGDTVLIIRCCRKVLLWCGVVLSVTVIPIFRVPYDSVVFTFWMTWVMLAILLPIFIYGHYFQCMKKLKQAKGWKIDGEEDCYWHWGIIYYNKDNPKLLIPHGTGNTFNLARLSGKIIMGLVVLCVVTLPLWGLWIVAEDFTEAEVTITEEAVLAEHLGTEYSVRYEEIEKVALLREMPECSRNSGYELTYLTKGNFTMEGYGKSYVCVDGRDAAILAMKTADKTYLISFNSESEAHSVIDKIEIK